MSHPLVSIVVATFNSGDTLRNCLESAVAQTLPEREILVIDGGSADGTVDILKSMEPDLAYWTSESDRGIYHAWNKALDRARGEWVTFLGADDTFAGANVLERLAPYLRTAYPQSRIVYSRMNVLDRAGRPVETWGRPWHELKDSFFVAMNTPHPGMMHHRNLFEEHGKFDESFRVAGDYDFLLRELRSRDPVFAADVTAVNMADGGMSRRLVPCVTTICECKRARAKNGAPGPQWRFWRWAAWILLRTAARAAGSTLAPGKVVWP